MGPEKVGSSPLSRGIHIDGPPVGVRGWIIPALAGNTDISSRACTSSWDHPRSRGEYNSALTVLLPPAGSSPLSRGIRFPVTGRRPFHRIIPALAGNTCLVSSGLDKQSDHPRSRGEYAPGLKKRRGPLGSSPLSRGIPATPVGLPTAIRIIPALAGNTVSAPVRIKSRADHPRSRGEYVQPRRRRRPVRGSSPLSRGIRVTTELANSTDGIIPALAGNTG